MSSPRNLYLIEHQTNGWLQDLGSSILWYQQEAVRQGGEEIPAGAARLIGAQDPVEAKHNEGMGRRGDDAP